MLPRVTIPALQKLKEFVLLSTFFSALHEAFVVQLTTNATFRIISFLQPFTILPAKFESEKSNGVTQKRRRGSDFAVVTL
jgi:hypothetical protein